MVLSLNMLYAQDCKVLSKTINEWYNGDCKKGKADGKGIAKGVDTYEGEFKKGYPDGFGTYTYQDGSIFTGKFKKGKKEGEGELTIKADNIVTGFWKKDEYVGLYENPYKKTDKSQNVTAYSIKQVETNINSIRLYVKKDNVLVKDPSFGNITVLNGNYQTTIPSRDYYEISNVTFPFKAKVFYGQEFVEFEIFNNGLWDVRLEITNINGYLGK